MEFFSPRFGWLLLVLLPLLKLSGARFRAGLITLASCLFYAAWDWRYLGLLLLIGGLDYLAAARIFATSRSGLRRGWLMFSLVTNLGLLSYFKYANFFREVAGLGPWDIVLPAGISFYTFKSLSYTIDVYRGQLQPCKGIGDYLFFVTFFPDLIAGPIVRASIFLPQLERSPGPGVDRWLVGANLFGQGLGKKILLADSMALLAEPVFACPQAFCSGSLWAALLAYSLQIYCDFSGYSDMAIGTAHMLGYDLPMNFNLPYLSCSLGEFWRRWHITLSQWLRDYLYIPLGGNRRPGALLVTMLLGGLWHGAGSTFLVWGALHGLALMLEHRFRGRICLAAPLAWFLTQAVVLLGWIFFRSPDLGSALVFVSRLWGAGGQQLELFWLWLGMALVVAGQGLTLGAERLEVVGGWLGIELRRLPLAGAYLCLVRANFFSAFGLTMGLFLLFFYGPTNPNPFLYFRF